MNENGANFTVVLQSINFSANVLAIDQITNIMYLYDNNEKTIVMTSLDGKHRKTISKDLGQVVDIALHELKGYLYFSDYIKSMVARVNTDGSNFLNFSPKSTSQKPKVTGLAIDKVEGRVYFCDNSLYKLESTDLHFQNYRLVIQSSYYVPFLSIFFVEFGRGFVVQPHSLAVLNEKIYWTDYYRRAIFEADKRFGAPIEYLTGGLDHPRDLHVFDNKITTGKFKDT